MSCSARPGPGTSGVAPASTSLPPLGHHPSRSRAHGMQGGPPQCLLLPAAWAGSETAPPAPMTAPDVLVIVPCSSASRAR